MDDEIRRISNSSSLLSSNFIRRASASSDENRGRSARQTYRCKRKTPQEAGTRFREGGQAVSPLAQGGGGNAVNGQREPCKRGPQAGERLPLLPLPHFRSFRSRIRQFGAEGNTPVSFSFMQSHVFSPASCAPDSICRPHPPVCLTGNPRRTIIFIVHTLRRRGEGREEAWRRKDIPTGKKAPWF